MKTCLACYEASFNYGGCETHCGTCPCCAPPPEPEYQGKHRLNEDEDNKD